MEALTVVLVVSCVMACALGAAWLDNKHGWHLVDFFNGRCTNPFISRETKFNGRIADKDQQIADLKARIEVLERIVTEPAYELNQKLNRL